MRAAGFVLTGGQSSRMGQDKALLPLDGRPLAAQIASTLQTVADPVNLVGHPQNYLDLPWLCLKDLRAGAGPMSGIETALSHTHADLNLIVGCDMPGIDKNLLQQLLQHASQSLAPCVVTCDANGRQHPLLAAYRVSCLPRLVAALDAGQRKLTRFVQEIGAEVWHSRAVIANVNTPDDWAQWQRENGK